MAIDKIDVKKFRNLNGITLNFSPTINAIAGQNGTSKTSILGLIGHIFTFSPRYKTLLGKHFRTEFSDIFRFAFPDFDKAGEHVWTTHFEDGKSIQAISNARIEKDKPTTIRVRVGRSMRGSGKLRFPVIYLGMGRLFPLTLEKSIKSNASTLNASEIQEFADMHNEILLMVDEQVQPESITTANKSFYAPKTTIYNHLGNSAGQDNLGQIITALLSFKRLRDDLGAGYHGGILLIDELDASLFPAAQIKLVEHLHQKALQLNLQIFFTTHSLEVLKETSKFNDAKSIFLDKSPGAIVVRDNLDYDELQKNLLVLGPDAFKTIVSKRFVYCEDHEAEYMLKSILPKEIKDKIDIYSTGLGQNQLKEIAKRRIPDFKNSIIILDGDSSSSSIRNVLTLPGKYGPDRILYDYLKSKDSTTFEGIQKGYTKQFCFKDFNVISPDSEPRTREKYKRWHKQQKKYWGNNARKVWLLWVADNQKDVNNFIDSFSKIL